MIGLVLTAIFFAMQMSKIQVEKAIHGTTVTYTVRGQVFFASVEPMMDEFDFKEDVELVILDFSQASLLDESAATALKKSINKFEGYGKRVEVRGLDAGSISLVSNLYGTGRQKA